MTNQRLNVKRVVVGLLAVFCSAVLVIGCASDSRKADAANDAGQTAAASEKGKAQLWGENCGRCHNTRSPDSYSDAEWEVAVQHMRIRGYLTGHESREIEEFLKSAN